MHKTQSKTQNEAAPNAKMIPQINLQKLIQMQPDMKLPNSALNSLRAANSQKQMQISLTAALKPKTSHTSPANALLQNTRQFKKANLLFSDGPQAELQTIEAKLNTSPLTTPKINVPKNSLQTSTKGPFRMQMGGINDSG